MTETSPWFIFDRHPNPHDLILFCLHFAGGNAAVFRDWQQDAPPHVTICRVQLPGHGTRMEEELLTDLPSIIDELQHAISPWLGYSYAFFGHSMGGSLAAEWVIRLQKEGLPLPICLFISASEPTHKVWRPSCSNLSLKEFRNFVFKNGGTPKEVLQNEELMEIFEPILRADYAVLENWIPKPVRPIHIPIVAFAGIEDHVVPPNVVSEWKIFAASSWRLSLVPGNHFFIQSHSNTLKSNVFNELKDIITGVEHG